MKKLLLAGVAAAAIGGFAFTPAANATVELVLTSNGHTSGVIPGTPSGNGSTIVYSGSVGDWTVNLVTGFSDGPNSPIMDLGSFDATSSANAAPLTVQLSDNGFLLGGTASLTGTGHLASGTGTATYSAYYDSGNALFAETSLIGTLGPFSGLYGAAGSGPVSLTTPYSLTQSLTLTAGSGGAQWSTDSSINVPEPGSLALLGTALLGLGFIGWSTKKRRAA